MGQPLRTLIRKLIRLTRAEWVALLRAQLALLAAQLVVWTRPQGRLVARGTPQIEPESDAAIDYDRAARLAVAVNRAARYGFTRPKCLVRAVALHRLLAADGMQGRVRIGVRKVNGRFDAHAWVELGKTVLGDSEDHTATFAELPNVSIIDKS